MVMEGVLKHLSDPRCKKPVQGTFTDPLSSSCSTGLSPGYICLQIH